MATSTQNQLFKSLTYVDDIKELIISSGGTIVFIKDNVIVASELSEAQYRELLDNPYVDKLDVLPLKRYGNEGIKYTVNDNISEVQSNTTLGSKDSITDI
jgi:hydroxymethylpyrimidine pyrophosphatase-like HAD family hydrolase